MNSKNVVSEGALYELLSRGNKDLYFFGDEASAVYPYDNRYVPQPPTISEIRILPPTQVQEFGRPLEFEFEIAGDSIIDPTFLIQLPSWIPQPYDALNSKSVITPSLSYLTTILVALTISFAVIFCSGFKFNNFLKDASLE